MGRLFHSLIVQCLPAIMIRALRGGLSVPREIVVEIPIGYVSP